MDNLLEFSSKLKLKIELVPSTAWKLNLRNYDPSLWERVRKEIYKANNYKCQICGGTGDTYPVECHEIWEYNDLTKTQLLKDLECLCPKCHAVKHLGRSITIGNKDECISHFILVNKIQKIPMEIVNDYFQSVLIQYQERSKFNWNLDVSSLQSILEHKNKEKTMNKPSALYQKNIVVYDLEIKENPAELSTGWKDFSKFGISVGCSVDFKDMSYHVYMDDNINELVDRLNEPGTLISGFNIISFDNKVLRTNVSKSMLKPDNELLLFDLFNVSKLGAGLSISQRQKGTALDDHLSVLGLSSKTGDGADAPKLWQDKKIGKLVDYCLNDVKVEKELLQYFWANEQSACTFKKQLYPIDISILKQHVTKEI